MSVSVSLSLGRVSLPLSLSTDDVPPLSALMLRERVMADEWLRLAKAYLNNESADTTQVFETLLRQFTEADDSVWAYPESHDRSSTTGLPLEGPTCVFNALAAYDVLKGSVTGDQERYTSATDLLNRSVGLGPRAPLAWVTQGVLMLLRGDLKTSAAAFNNALLTDKKDNPLVRLGLGCILVHEKKYAEALKQYRAALHANPTLPGFVRIGLAICYYNLGDTVQCRASFQRVLDMSEGSENVHALLGLATLDMNEWREAANQIEIETRKNQATSSSHASQLQAKLQTLGKDERITNAFKHLEAAYQIDPTNPHTLLLLSSHSFYLNNFEKSCQFAKKAIQSCNARPSLATDECKALAFYHLARGFHAAHDMPKAAENYARAKDLLPHNPLVCLGHAQMLVSRGETEQAIENLELVIAGANKAATGGKDAISAADRKQIAAAASNNFEVLRLLGSLYAMPPSAGAAMTAAALLTGKSGKDKSAAKDKEAALILPDFEKSFSYLKKSVDLHPNSMELLLEFAEVSARLHEYNESYLAYKRCLKLMTELHKMALDSISAEMLHNLGVICQQLHKYDESRQYYEWSLRNRSTSAAGNADAVAAPMEIDDAARVIPADKVTTHYNLGLLQATSGSAEAALAKMHDILEQYPTYTDAMLYTGAVYQRGGDFPKAKKQLDAALEFHTTAAASADPAAVAAAAAALPVIQCALGTWHLAQHEIDGAHACFQFILMKLGQTPSAATGRKDEYAKLSLGNLAMHKQVRKVRTIQLANPGLPLDHPNFEAKAREANVDWREVSAFFTSSLRSDPRNLYAAHGLGCVLAHQGKTTEAKEIFQQVKDISAAATAGGNNLDTEMPDVWCNLGHVYVQQGSYISAVKMYQHCLRNFRDTRTLSTVQVLTYLARAYYLSDAFQDAKRTLLKALQLAPTATPLWYNLGLISEAYAISVFQKPPALRTYREVESAILELNQAFAIFTRLQTTQASRADRELHGDIADKAGRHSVFCRMSITNGQPHLAFARQREEEQARVLEESRVAKQKLDESIASQAEAAAAATVAEQQRMEAEALANKKHLEDISVLWETVTSEENVKKERRTRDTTGGGDEEYTGVDHDAEMVRRRERSKPARATSSAPKPKRIKRERDSGSDDEEAAPVRQKAKKKKKLKGRSKYHEASGSDAERSASPAPRGKREGDVDDELAARRAKAPHLTGLIAGESKEKRRLTKATAESDDEEGERAPMEDDEEPTTKAEEDESAPIDDANVDVGGDEEEEEAEQQQQRKKGSKKRRQIEEDDEEAEAPAADAAEEATAMTDE